MSDFVRIARTVTGPERYTWTCVKCGAAGERWWGRKAEAEAAAAEHQASHEERNQ